MKNFKLFLAKYFPRRISSGFFLGTLCAMSLWLLAPEEASSQSSVQRDQQALTILTQTITAAGGSELLASIQTITETGKITYFGPESDEVHGNVTVKGRGLHQLKIEADLSTGMRTTLVNGAGGALIEANGKEAPLHSQSAIDLGSLTLPYLPLIAAMQDTHISIIYEGVVNHNSASAYNIRLQRVYSKQQDPQGDRGMLETHDIYIDPTTLLITAVADQLYLAGPKRHGIEHEDLYSDYHENNGIMMPSTIEQKFSGKTTLTMTLDQVTINMKLDDTDFSW